MKKEYMRQLGEMMLGTIVNALGLYFMIKSGLGQTAFVSLSRNFAHMTHIKEGSMIMIFNLSCTCINWMILKRNFKKIQLCQFGLSFLQGQTVNMLLYRIPVMKDLSPASYLHAIILLFTGILVASYGVAMIMNANLIKMPLEDLCMVISQLLKREFSQVRQWADILFICLSIILILICGFDWSTLREGTWMCMLLFGPSMKYTFPLARHYSLLIPKVSAS